MRLAGTVAASGFAAMGAGLLLLAQSAVDFQTQDTCDIKVCEARKLCGQILAECPGLERYGDVLGKQECEPSSMSLLDVLQKLEAMVPELIEGE